MFPIKDENPTYHKTYVTYIFIVLNVLSWIFLQGLGFEPGLAKSICEYGFIPGDLLSLVKPGTQVPLGPETACVVDGKPNWITVISSMFMHGGWFHIIGNMWFLFVFGDNVEDVLGSFKFILFYLLCGAAAAGAQMLADPSSPIPMVGASGAVSGVMGAYIVLFPRAPIHVLVFFFIIFFRVVMPAFIMLGYWFFLQVAGGMLISGGTGGVAFWAHIGGFVAGIVFLKVLCSTGRVEQCKMRRRNTERFFRRYR